MSRYVNVRGKHRHKHPAPAAAEAAGKPAAGTREASQPPMPTEAQMEAVARERLQHTHAELYKLYHGDTLDKSIARCNKLLALHDREIDKLEQAEETAGHRWTVSPSMAFRLQREVERLEARQDRLKDECWVMAKEMLAQAVQQKAEEAQRQKQALRQGSWQAEADSLCPPKQTSATEAGKGTVPVSAARDSLNTNDQPGGNRDCPPAEGGPATAPPIAA